MSDYSKNQSDSPNIELRNSINESDSNYLSKSCVAPAEENKHNLNLSLNNLSNNFNHSIIRSERHVIDISHLRNGDQNPNESINFNFERYISGLEEISNL